MVELKIHKEWIENAVKEQIDDIKEQLHVEREQVIKDFIDYAIKERCEGCKECDPKKNGSQAIVCVEQGFAQWLMYTGERWQQAKGGKDDGQ